MKKTEQSLCMIDGYSLEANTKYNRAWFTSFKIIFPVGLHSPREPL